MESRDLLDRLGSISASFDFCDDKINVNLIYKKETDKYFQTRGIFKVICCQEFLRFPQIIPNLKTENKGVFNLLLLTFYSMAPSGFHLSINKYIRNTATLFFM